MAAGLVVIGSFFPLWKDIIEGNNCGYCVNPEDPLAISKAIQQVMDDNTLSEEMANNGRKAVKEKYSWETEEKKLIVAYNKLAEDTI